MSTKKKSFAYGWGLQVLVALMFFFYAGLAVDGQNISVPAFANSHGWDYGTILSLSTPASWVGLVGIIFFSWLVDKKGNRFTIPFALIGSGIACFIYGQASSIPMYAVAICLVFFFTNGYGNVCTGALTSSWFPRKRGLALGWSSMGMPLATAVFVPIFAVLIGKFGLPTALSVFGIAVIILGIISIFWVKNTPEEMGLYPDGDDSGLENLEKTRQLAASYKSDWTVGRLLTNKTVWIQSVCYGLLFLTTIGLVSQMIPRMIGLGHTQQFGLMMLSLAAVVGIVGSIVWGLIDMKIGTKKSTILYAVWYIVAIIVLLASTKSVPGTVVGICMAGWGIGGIGNLQPSMLAQTFGRWDYASASRVVNTIVGAIRVMAFGLIGITVSFSGSIDKAYLFLVAGNVIALILAVILDDRLIGKEISIDYDDSTEEVSQTCSSTNVGNA